ncbi:MAG: YgaP family membrane protein [Candidatus Latescibacterota bacterium]
MTLERSIRMLAGIFVLIGLALGRWVDVHWYLFTAFVGLNLLQSAVTGWCPAESILKRTIFKSGITAR